MRLIRNFAKNPFVVLLMTALIFTTSCTQQEALEQANAVTGEDLFRGIFLVDGDIAKKLDMYTPLRSALEKEYQKDPTLKTKKEELNQQLVDQVTNLRPNYFEELHQAVQSQNINSIETALQDGAKVMQTAIYIQHREAEAYKDVFARVDWSNYDLATEEGMTAFLNDSEKLLIEAGVTPNFTDNSRSTAFAAAFAAVAVVAAVVWDAVALINVAAAVNVAAWVMAVYDVVCADEGTVRNDNQLEKEKFMHQIAFDLL